LIQNYLPSLPTALDYFASPLLQTSATIGGNIANGSPTADVMPLLLVLDARLELLSAAGSRKVVVSEFYTGYKKNIMQSDEIISKIIISKNAEKDWRFFYEKVGARKTLTIAKVALAGLKKVEDGKITGIKLAVGSLNEYARRLPKMENYLLGKTLLEIDADEIDEILKQEITPITDLRSDQEYRFRVCANLLKKFGDK